MGQGVKTGMNPKVDVFLSNAGKWQQEYELLRKIIQSSQLIEEFKWGKPCYTFEGKNVVLMHGFKEYSALLFMKGALLKDARGIMISQTENTQATRQIRFTSVQEIEELEPVLKACINEAIIVEKAGLKVNFKKTEDFGVPTELQHKLDVIPGLKDAFYALTPGRQRGYLLYFSAAKQSKTRDARIEKCMPLIFDGMGINDR